MKIYTLTYHNSFSHGALLQCYALQQYFLDLNEDCYVLDYRCKAIKEDTMLINPRVFKERSFKGKIFNTFYSLLTYSDWMRKKKTFDKFLSNNIILTKEKYNSYEELNSSFIDADIIFSGSDQIWNPDILIGFDPAYFLHFPTNAIKCSFAGSVGVSLNDEKKLEFLELAKNLDYPLTREVEIKDMLIDNGFENVYNVCDPVFLLDKKHWLSKCHSIDTEKFVFVYNLSYDERLYRKAKEYATLNNLKVIDFGLDKRRENPYNFERIFNQDPFDLISLINQAEAVFTSSFHGLAMSIILNKEVFVYLPYLRVGRLVNLANIAGLDERIIDENYVFNADKINYSIINANIDDYISSTKEILTVILGEANEKNN